MPSLLYGPTCTVSHPYMTTGKTIALTIYSLACIAKSYSVCLLSPRSKEDGGGHLIRSSFRYQWQKVQSNQTELLSHLQEIEGGSEESITWTLRTGAGEGLLSERGTQHQLEPACQNWQKVRGERFWACSANMFYWQNVGVTEPEDQGAWQKLSTGVDSGGTEKGSKGTEKDMEWIWVCLCVNPA